MMRADKTPPEDSYVYPSATRNAISFFAENEYFLALMKKLYKYWNK